MVPIRDDRSAARRDPWVADCDDQARVNLDQGGDRGILIESERTAVAHRGAGTAPPLEPPMGQRRERIRRLEVELELAPGGKIGGAGERTVEGGSLCRNGGEP